MTWTAPMTFTSNSVLTASQMNAFVRDNLLETAPAKATTAGSYFVTASANQIIERIPVRAEVVTTETTTSNSYTDLATVGPSVTVSTGPSALCLFGGQMSSSVSNNWTALSPEVSGATSIAADDARSYTHQNATNNSIQAGNFVFYDTLTPGSNTFTIKYRVMSGNTGTFYRRRIAVFPY